MCHARPGQTVPVPYVSPLFASATAPFTEARGARGARIMSALSARVTSVTTVETPSLGARFVAVTVAAYTRMT